MILFLTLDPKWIFDNKIPWTLSILRKTNLDNFSTRKSTSLLATQNFSNRHDFFPNRNFSSGNFKAIKVSQISFIFPSECQDFLCKRIKRKIQDNFEGDEKLNIRKKNRICDCVNFSGFFQVLTRYWIVLSSVSLMCRKLWSFVSINELYPEKLNSWGLTTTDAELNQHFIIKTKFPEFHFLIRLTHRYLQFHDTLKWWKPH